MELVFSASIKNSFEIVKWYLKTAWLYWLLFIWFVIEAPVLWSVWHHLNTFSRAYWRNLKFEMLYHFIPCYNCAAIRKCWEYSVVRSKTNRSVLGVSFENCFKLHFYFFWKAISLLLYLESNISLKYIVVVITRNCFWTKHYLTSLVLNLKKPYLFNFD